MISYIFSKRQVSQTPYLYNESPWFEHQNFLLWIWTHTKWLTWWHPKVIPSRVNFFALMCFVCVIFCMSNVKNLQKLCQEYTLDVVDACLPSWYVQSHLCTTLPCFELYTPINTLFWHIFEAPKIKEVLLGRER